MSRLRFDLRSFVVGSLAAIALGSTASAATEQPVSVSVTGGHLNGTLMLPDGAGPFAVAVIIAGSGPTDRDGNGPMMHGDVYKRLATDLASGGIATLRYDKRDSGTSVMQSESTLRFDDLVADAVAVTSALEHDARFRSVSIVGHSEGALVGILATQHDPNVAAFASLEGPGRNLAAILDEQLSSNPGVPAAVAREARAIDASLRVGKTVSNVDPALLALFRPSVQPYLVSEFGLDPDKELAKVRVPILIVQGTTDLQVGLPDERLLAAAAPKAKAVVIDGMNHELVDAPADRASNLATYGNAALPLDPMLVSSLTHFIATVAPSPSASPSATPAAAAAAAATASPTPAPALATASPAGDAIAARAKSWLHAIATGKIDRAQLTPQANTAFTDQVVTSVASQLGPLGDPTSFTYVDTQNGAGNTSYIYKATYPTTSFYFIFTLDDASKVSGLLLRPAPH